MRPTVWMVAALIVVAVSLALPSLAQPPMPGGNPPPPSFQAVAPGPGPGQPPPPPPGDAQPPMGGPPGGPGGAPPPPPGMAGPPSGPGMTGGYGHMPPPPPGGRRRGEAEGLMALALLLMALEGLVVAYAAYKLLRLAQAHCGKTCGEIVSPPPAA